MIRVNLAGTARKKTKKAAAKSGKPSGLLPVLHLLLMIGTVAGGYLWYSSLNTQSTDLAAKIVAKEAERKSLEAIIAQDAIYEGRKAELERRIKIIDDLKKSQVSPVVMLDKLVESVDRTRFVWLSNFTQNNSAISIVGTATTLEALASFYSNLETTGYFHNINVEKFEDTRGNVAFSLKCEFAPPSTPQSAEKGAN